MSWLDSSYVQACKLAGKFNAFKRARHTADELRENIEFVGLGVEPSEVAALALFSALVGSIFASIIVTLGFLTDKPLLLAIAMPLPLCTYIFAGWYPKWRAEKEGIRGAGEVPTLVSYMVLSMKMVPNLERSTKFAVERVSGPLGRDLRNSLWQVYISAHDSIDEALTKFADRWGRWCGDLKRSIRLIKSSTSERGENRIRTLDRALEISLHGITERMREFAAKLHQPTLVIYSLGILLPLVLVATFPVLSVMGIGIGVWQAFAIYCVILPIGVYTLSKWVLAKRPSTFKPPEIPRQANRARGALAAVGVGLAVAFMLFWLLPLPLAGSLSSLWGLTLTVTLYLHLTSAREFEQRSSIKRMEGEFCDSLVHLGNLMREGRPAEDAFERVAEGTRGSRIAKVYEKTSANVRVGGMGLRAALFDPERGALRDVHSHTIQSVFSILVDAIERSTRVAGTLISRMADQLKELRQVETDIKRSLGEIVNSMRSVALFFAPLVAAVIGSLQGALIPKSNSVPFLGAGSSAFPTFFIFVLGLYVLLLTLILISYSTEIEAGKDPLLKRFTIARAVLISMGVFTIGIILGRNFFGALFG